MSELVLNGCDVHCVDNLLAGGLGVLEPVDQTIDEILLVHFVVWERFHGTINL